MPAPSSISPLVSDRLRKTFTRMWEDPANYSTSDISARFNVTAQTLARWAEILKLKPRTRGVTSASHYKRG